MPLLSIVIPVLEPDSELDRCIYAIRGALGNQEPAEIIIVTPPRYVAEARRRFPDTVVIADSRKGIYAAMNDGARVSRGRYVYFLGKDDIVLPAFGAAIIDLRNTAPFALYCDVYWGSSGVYRNNPSRFSILARNVCHQGAIYSRAAFVRHGPYLRRMRVQADHLLNIKVLWDRDQRPENIRYLRQPIAWYSGSGFSGTNRDATFWRVYPTILRRYVGAWACIMLKSYRCLRGRY